MQRQYQSQWFYERCCISITFIRPLLSRICLLRLPPKPALLVACLFTGAASNILAIIDVDLYETIICMVFAPQPLRSKHLLHVRRKNWYWLVRSRYFRRSWLLYGTYTWFVRTRICILSHLYPVFVGSSLLQRNGYKI
jgi:hypothetical protein